MMLLQIGWWRTESFGLVFVVVKWYILYSVTIMIKSYLANPSFSSSATHRLFNSSILASMWLNVSVSTKWKRNSFIHCGLLMPYDDILAQVMACSLMTPMLTYHQCGPVTITFNINMPSYQYRKSHCGDKMILWPSYLHNGISHTGKMASL